MISNIFSRKELIEENDLAVIYYGNNFRAIRLVHGRNFETNHGKFAHSDIIGKKYGIKIGSKNNKGHIYIFAPTPYLWTLSLSHRTQILYSTNISLILSKLNIIKNTLVVEAGTGSGSLSHSIAHAIQPNGHLYTFEFHDDRFKKACEEFNEHGLGGTITVTHADVTLVDFKVPTRVDAVILDLPRPWAVIEKSKLILKKNSCARICIFSPCIEQVEKSIDVLEEEGFKSIEVVECLERPMILKNISMPIFKPTTNNSHENMNIIENEHQTYDYSATTNEQMINYSSAIPIKEMKGHTGYLLFAILNH